MKHLISGGLLAVLGVASPAAAAPRVHTEVVHSCNYNSLKAKSDFAGVVAADPGTTIQVIGLQFHNSGDKAKDVRYWPVLVDTNGNTYDHLSNYNGGWNHWARETYGPNTHFHPSLWVYPGQTRRRQIGYLLPKGTQISHMQVGPQRVQFHNFCP